MHTLIIYDNQGYIFFQGQGNLREPQGIPFLWVDIPEGKYVKSVDVSTSTHKPVFAYISKSEVELLKEQVDSLNIAMANLMGGVTYANLEENNICKCN
jgi:hypothetical protein